MACRLAPGWFSITTEERLDYLNRVGSHVCEGRVENDQPHILPIHSLLVTFQSSRVYFLTLRSPPDVGCVVGWVGLNLGRVGGVNHLSPGMPKLRCGIHGSLSDPPQNDHWTSFGIRSIWVLVDSRVAHLKTTERCSSVSTFIIIGLLSRFLPGHWLLRACIRNSHRIFALGFFLYFLSL